MEKTVLVLTSSPRKDGNSDLMAAEFIQGAKEAGHQILRFDAARKKVNGCRACQKCYTNGSACVFNDDFNEFAALAEQADTLVICTPLYWFNFPSQIKAVMDKWYSFMVAEKELRIKEVMLLACGETDRLEDFDGMVKTYQSINDYMKWKDAGVLLALNVNQKGDILKTDYLEQVHKMGRELS